QVKQGVSAARNLGLRISKGKYIVFLDHDDRLLPTALEVGVHYLTQFPEAGFAFGCCRNVDAQGQLIENSNRSILERSYDHPIYPNILKGNSVHPPARHLFQRTVFDVVGEFDTSLTVAEDYDMYLRVAAAFPGHSHNHTVVEYRDYQSSASATARPSQHLLASMRVLNKQKPVIRHNRDYQEAYRVGRKHWQQIYSRFVVYDIAVYLKAGKVDRALIALYLLLRYYPQGLVQLGAVPAKLVRRIKSPLGTALQALGHSRRRRKDDNARLPLEASMDSQG
ncbi:MAG TPA: glycosyltransferase, partial [Allocoleopsis sp.]